MRVRNPSSSAGSPPLDVNRRLELALVGRAEAEGLRSTVDATFSAWFGRSASNSISADGRSGSSPRSRWKCGSRAADDGVAETRMAGVAVVGVEPVALPRVVS